MVHVPGVASEVEGVLTMLGIAFSQRPTVAAALAGGIIALSATTPSQAAPIPLAFDFTSGLPTTIATVIGSGGLMEFSLDVGDPTRSNVFGNFSIDITGPGSSNLGSVKLIGAPLLDGAFQSLGDAAANPGTNSPIGLADLSTWFLNVGTLDLPLNLVVTSQLDTLGAPFTPLLTVEFTGDLTAMPAVPLGTSWQFASGIGFLILMCSRRMRRYLVR
jgi:hypothetical protein